MTWIAPRTERTWTTKAAAATLLADRLAGFPPWVVTTQLFIGLGWFRAVAEKVIDLGWWSGTTIDAFLTSHRGSTLGWYQPFIDGIVIPGTPLIAVFVVVGQLIAAISLISGRRLALGVGIGMFLNVHFLAAGAVSPSAFYLLSQGALVLWMIEQRPSGETIRGLRWVAAAATFVAATNLLFISTIHPHDVIEDPVIMFVLGGILTTLACLLAGDADVSESAPPPAAADRSTGPPTEPGGFGGAFSAQIGPR